MDRSDQGRELRRAGRFTKKRTGAEQISLTDVVGVLRTGEHDDGDDGKRAVSFDKTQETKTVSWGHPQVREDVGRKLEECSVGIFALAGDISDCFIAVAQRVDAVVGTELLEGALEKEAIGLVVVDNEQRKFLGFHRNQGVPVTQPASCLGLPGDMG